MGGCGPVVYRIVTGSSAMAALVSGMECRSRKVLRDFCGPPGHAASSLQGPVYARCLIRLESPVPEISMPGSVGRGGDVVNGGIATPPA